MCEKEADASGELQIPDRTRTLILSFLNLERMAERTLMTAVPINVVSLRSTSYSS